MARVIAVVPARSGSKRLPGKNIKRFYNRPLIAYSCLAAQATLNINRVVAASDDVKILSAAQPYVDDMIELPEFLTGDHDPLTETLRYVLNTLKYGDKVDWVVLLQPTCPLRQPSLMDRWINIAIGGTREVDGILTVDQSRYKMGRKAGELFVPQYIPMTPKAQVDYQYRENGVFYMFKADNVRAGYPFSYRMHPVPTSEPESLANIDEQFHWDLAKWLYHKYGFRELFDRLEEQLKDGTLAQRKHKYAQEWEYV